MLRVPSKFALLFAFLVIAQHTTMAAPITKKAESGTTWESVKAKFDEASGEVGVFVLSLFVNAEQKVALNDIKNNYMEKEKAIEEYNGESKETKDEFLFAAKKLQKVLFEYLETGKRLGKTFNLDDGRLNDDESPFKKVQLLYGQMQKDIEATENGTFVSWIQKIDI